MWNSFFGNYIIFIHLFRLLLLLWFSLVIFTKNIAFFSVLIHKRRKTQTMKQWRITVFIPYWVIDLCFIYFNSSYDQILPRVMNTFLFLVNVVPDSKRSSIIRPLGIFFLPLYLHFYFDLGRFLFSIISFFLGYIEFCIISVSLRALEFSISYWRYLYSKYQFIWTSFFLLRNTDWHYFRCNANIEISSLTKQMKFHCLSS